MPRQRRFDFAVTGSPAEVAERLSAHTRWRLFPHQGSVLGRGALGGRVGADGFVVSLDAPSWFQPLLAVARGRLEDRGDGTTRVHGVAGMPPWVTWGLRAGFLVVPAFVAAAVGSAATGGEFAAMFGLGAAMFGTLVATAGWHVHRADDSVDALVEQVTRAVAANAAGAEPNSERERADRARLDQRARQAERER